MYLGCPIVAERLKLSGRGVKGAIFRKMINENEENSDEAKSVDFWNECTL
jgi:hypothetical protein